MNKSDYIASTEEFIKKGHKLVKKDPLPGMIRRTKEAVKAAETVFNNEEFFTLKLHVSNPILPRLYTQLKLHKPGRKVRPITTNNNAPTEKLAIWLLKKFNSMNNQFETSSVKNAVEYVNKIKNLDIAENEMQVSFDVESLYPNVPIDVALIVLRNWLGKNQLKKEEIDVLVNLTQVCMHENWFQMTNAKLSHSRSQLF